VKRNIFGSILFLIISASIFAQTESASDSLEFKPLGKGSFLVGLGGSISSNNIAQSTFTTNAAQFGNTYQFDVLLGRFVADKNLLGLQFNTKKVSLLGEIETTADVTNIGPMYRLYFGKDPNIALFLHTSIKWSSYEGLSRGSISFITVDQEIRAQGVLGSLGLGVSYIMARRVAFDVSCKYTLSRYWGTMSDFELNVEDDIILDFRGLNFTFGFNVLFGKIKQDD
jgi:hypothetical protein